MRYFRALFWVLIIGVVALLVNYLFISFQGPRRELPLSTRGHFIRIKGLQVHYLAAGKGEPVILLHGLGASAKTWKSNLTELSRHFRVYAVDLVGFGDSDKPWANYSTEYFVKFLRDFMDFLKIRKASVVGSSYGGKIALTFGLRHPARVDRLILVDSAGLPQKTPLVLSMFRLPVIGESLVSLMNRENLRQHIKEKLFHDAGLVKDDTVELFYQYVNTPGWKRAYLSSLRFSTRSYFKEGDLRTLQKPVLVIWGRGDRLIPLEDARTFTRWLKNSKLVLIEKAGHLPFLENASAFNRAVLDFLKAGK